MAVAISYPSAKSGLCVLTDAAGIWAVAAQVRRQLGLEPGQLAIEHVQLTTACRKLIVNEQGLRVMWDCVHEVHDDDGAPVEGVCETDGESNDCIYASVNGPMFKGRKDRLLSTTAHELGHAILDLPAALAAQRPQRCFTRDSEASPRSISRSEWRANEFMGALLTPPFILHRELLRRARSEDMKLVRAKHLGRPTWPALDCDNDEDALAGIKDVLAEDFGVSPRFISVRLRRYGLIDRFKGDHQ